MPKSSVSLWVRDLPKPPPRMTPEEKAWHMAEVRWGSYRRQVGIARQQTKLAAAQEIGRMSDRELFMAGAALYWAEGTKDKAYARRGAVQFVNSDPDVVTLFLRWLEPLGVERERWRFTLSIHESGDIAAAGQYWADPVGIPVESL